MKPEFSRIFDTNDLKEGSSEFKLIANEAERVAISKRFGLLEMGNLSADIRITKGVDPSLPLLMEAQVSGQYLQECVVSLEAVRSICDEFVSCSLAYRNECQVSPLEVEINLDDDDPPEQLIDGKFDAGELIAEYFGLNVDPFPRAAGAKFESSSISVGESGSINNPFAVLKKFQDKSSPV